MSNELVETVIFSLIWLLVGIVYLYYQVLRVSHPASVTVNVQTYCPGVQLVF